MWELWLHLKTRSLIHEAADDSQVISIRLLSKVPVKLVLDFTQQSFTWVTW